MSNRTKAGWVYHSQGDVVRANERLRTELYEGFTLRWLVAERFHREWEMALHGYLNGFEDWMADRLWERRLLIRRDLEELRRGVNLALRTGQTEYVFDQGKINGGAVYCVVQDLRTKLFPQCEVVDAKDGKRIISWRKDVDEACRMAELLSSHSEEAPNVEGESKGQSKRGRAKQAVSD